MSFLSMMKLVAPELPRPVGELLAKLPYDYRPTIGGSYRRTKALRAWFDEQATPEERRAFILNATRRLVGYAVENVPFYRSYYREQGFSVGDLRAFDDIASIPVVSKALLQEVPLEERSARRFGRTLTHTGGSTGEPFRFYSDYRQLGNEWAHMHYVWSRLGYRSSDLLLTVCLEPERPVVYYDALRHALALNIHYDRSEVARAFMTIPASRRRCAFFRGYPSAISEFLDYCERRSSEILTELRSSLRGSFLASEYPHPSFRQTIERATGRGTISWYGLSERVLLAYERDRPYEYSPLHSYGYCEAIADESGFTSLVGTSYYNYASPLIRYRIDDGIGDLKYEDGILSSFRIKEGRQGDYLIDKSGARFSITHLNLSCRPETWELARFIQVEQRTPGRAIIWVTPRRETSIAELENAFQFGALNLECEFRIVSEPILSPRGKALLKIETAEQS
ncbi:MAG: hypothetical protein IJU03_02260 [Thermoguttaceae bacterium]|nr:hypothetical protein [Thermoguttaceae bacterium]